MEEHISRITHWFNHVFGPLALRLFHSLNIQPRDFEKPIPEHVVMAFLVLIVGTIFVLLSNLLSVIPAFTSPTGNAVVPLACALLTFVYFNWQGIRHHGLGGYLMTFAGSPKTAGDGVLALLLFPVEIISTSARILSLTVRLWANIFASDLIYVIFLGLLAGPVAWAWSKSPVLGAIVAIFPIGIPIAFIALHVFVSIIQAYIFTVLPSIYIGGAVAEEH